MPGSEFLASLGPDGALHRGEIISGLMAGGTVLALIAARPRIVRYAGTLVAVAVTVGLAQRSLPAAGAAVVALGVASVDLEARAQRVITAVVVTTLGLVTIDEVGAWWPLPVVAVAGGLVVTASRPVGRRPAGADGVTAAGGAVAAWAAVPDTEVPVLVGAAMVAAMPAWYVLGRAPGPGKVHAATGSGLLVVWAAVLGAIGRPAAVVGALGWLGPWAVHARWGPRRPVLLGPFLVVTSGLMASRIAGDHASWATALARCAAVAGPAAAVLVVLGRRSGYGAGTASGPVDA